MTARKVICTLTNSIVTIVVLNFAITLAEQNHPIWAVAVAYMWSSIEDTIWP